MSCLLVLFVNRVFRHTHFRAVFGLTAHDLEETAGNDVGFGKRRLVLIAKAASLHMTQ
jgi:hypothetical protein